MKRNAVLIPVVLFAFVAIVMAYVVEQSPAEARRLSDLSYESRDGRKEALADIADGAPKWIVYGEHSFDSEKARRLKSALGLRMTELLDYYPLPPDGLKWYRYSYNSTIREYYVAICGEEYVAEILGAEPVMPSDQR